MKSGGRPRVLMLAFACEPDFGSEPEVGWRWALEMAHYANVTVVTDEGHRLPVEAKLRGLRGEHPEKPDFVFFGPGPRSSLLYKFLGYRGYYPWWMKRVRPVIAGLHRTRRFDLMHHVTYAGCRFSTAVWGQGAPVIWGPVGGLESMPLDVIPWSQPKTAAFEVARNLGSHVVGRHLKRGGWRSARVLASTHETRNAFSNVGVRADLMATIGIEKDVFASAPVSNVTGPLRLVFAGRLLAWKGIELALQAVAQVPGVVFTLIGDGPFAASARGVAKSLGVESRVVFQSALPRAELLKEYRAHHVLLYPSLHDSGGFVVLEAMANGLPVICVDCGGPGMAVEDGCGVKVPLTARGEIVEGLAAAIRRYESHRELVCEEGINARRSVEKNYLWARKGEKMAAIYEAVLETAASNKSDPHGHHA